MNLNIAKSLRPIMFLSKAFGTCRFSCRLNSDSTLLYSSNSKWFTVMDVVQMAFFLACTYTMLQMPTFIFRYFSIGRHWLILILLRFSEDSIIRLTNGIANFYRKLSMLRALLPAVGPIRIAGGRLWSAIIVVYFVYYAWIVSYMNLFVVRKINFKHLIESAIYSVPRIADFVVVITVCFYLYHLGHGFLTLDALWEQLLPSSPEPGGWTTVELAVLAECVRLLHAELVDLFALFNRTYGILIVVFFVSVVSDMSFHFFIVLFGHKIKLDPYPAIMLDVQNTMFIVTVFGLTTWVNQCKKNMVSLLKCHHVTGLSTEIQIQIRYFMNQISTYDLNETLACGMLNYDLRTLISIIVFLIKLTATFIQMNDQSYFKIVFDEFLTKGPWNE